MRKAHLLARKTGSVKVIEQPFPDSWIATTAPIALGFLTDITSEFILCRNNDSQNVLWPLITSQYKLWCVGRGNVENKNETSWSPSEALVRISCRELYRLSSRLFLDKALQSMSSNDRDRWTSLLLVLFSDLLAESLDAEIKVRSNLLAMKEKAGLERKDKDDDCELDFEVVKTPFGRGRLVDRHRKNKYPGAEIAVDVIELDFGATLFQPVRSVNQNPKDSIDLDIPTEVDGKIHVFVTNSAHSIDIGSPLFLRRAQFRMPIGCTRYRLLKYVVLRHTVFKNLSSMSSTIWLCWRPKTQLFLSLTI